jgi:hypothetical protein
VGLKQEVQVLEGRSESEGFSTYASESAQFPSEEICAEGRKEGLCNANAESCSGLGQSYANDTGLDGRFVLTVSTHCTVKEIEVFEIAD